MTALILGAWLSLHSGDPLPYWRPLPLGPVVAHWVATECAVDDAGCLEDHDSRAMDLAIMTGDPLACHGAVDAGRCARVARMALGTVRTASR